MKQSTPLFIYLIFLLHSSSLGSLSITFIDVDSIMGDVDAFKIVSGTTKEEDQQHRKI
jgi:hypothetical protein